MSLMMGSVYDAFRSANVPDEKAREAAQDIAQYDDRLHGIERKVDSLESRVAALDAKVDSRFNLLQWMVGANTVLTVGVLLRLLTG